MNQSTFPRSVSLAMSYVPWQTWTELYDEKCALERGTAFPALYMPFIGKKVSV